MYMSSTQFDRELFLSVYEDMYSVGEYPYKVSEIARRYRHSFHPITLDGLKKLIDQGITNKEHISKAFLQIVNITDIPK